MEKAGHKSQNGLELGLGFVGVQIELREFEPAWPPFLHPLHDRVTVVNRVAESFLISFFLLLSCSEALDLVFLPPLDFVEIGASEWIGASFVCFNHI